MSPNPLALHSCAAKIANGFSDACHARCEEVVIIAEFTMQSQYGASSGSVAESSSLPAMSITRIPAVQCLNVTPRAARSSRSQESASADRRLCPTTETWTKLEETCPEVFSPRTWKRNNGNEALTRVAPERMVRSLFCSMHRLSNLNSYTSWTWQKRIPVVMCGVECLLTHDTCAGGHHRNAYGGARGSPIFR